jgi:entericidin B
LGSHGFVESGETNSAAEAGTGCFIAAGERAWVGSRVWASRVPRHRSAGIFEIAFSSHAHEGSTMMRKNFSIAFTLLVLVALAPLLGACQTAAGVGQDLSAGGKAITNSAEKHAP